MDAGQVLAQLDDTDTQVRLAQAQDAKDALLCHSGTSALQVAVGALGIGEGEEVIIKRAPHGGLLLLPKAITYEHVKAVCEMQADAFERDQPAAQDRGYT